MKKRILFVDDEPLVLQGLQRMLRAMRDEWEMHFAEGGQQALEMFAQAPFEVVVTDMRMPNMNGAELLKAVQKHYPTTIRIVLSGHADKSLVSQCVGVAHQYLSKPCDSERLKARVRDALNASEASGNGEVKSLIASIDNLPSVPALYMQIMEALDRESVSTQHLASIIQQDMAMTAKVLKLVNSTFFGLRRTIETPADALVYLGVDTLRALVLANGIFEQAQTLAITGFTLQDLWHHSMRVASGAFLIAQTESRERAVQEEAFVAGILHDLGILIFAVGFPEAYTQVTQEAAKARCPLAEKERSRFQASHSEVGAYLLGLWGIPAPIRDIVACHHLPEQQGPAPTIPMMAVQAADILTINDATHPLFRLETDREELLRSYYSPSKVDAWATLLQMPGLEGVSPLASPKGLS